MLDTPWFDNQDIIQFPDPKQASIDPDGLLAIGGNLSTNTLYQAYSQGVFPWFEEDQPILWWSPSIRAVINTKAIHVSKNMKKLINKNHYTITVDKQFDEVLWQCSQLTDDRQATWITEEMQMAYRKLFDKGIAHSVEVLDASNQLVGGLYGVFIKNCFCGESMFSHRANTSKLALISLAKWLENKGCPIIDCQLPTEHLSSMGAKPIERANFLKTIQMMEDNPQLSQTSWVNLWRP